MATWSSKVEKLATTGLVDLSETKDSDEFDIRSPRFTCSPCAKGGMKKNAPSYCIDCGEHFCKICIDFHNKMASLSFHEVIQANNLAEMNSHNKPSFPTERCTVHHGRLMDTFCAEHDVICCATCVAINHRTCDGIQYLPDVARGVRGSRAFRSLQGAMGDCFRELDQQEKLIAENMKRTKHAKENGIKSVSNLTEKLIFDLKEKQANAIHAISEKYEQRENLINGKLQKVHDLRTGLEKDWEKLNDKTVNNESQLFVFAQTGKSTVAMTEQQLREIEPVDQLPIFLLSQEMENCLNREPFGIFSKVVPSLLGDYQVVDEDDHDVCDVNGCCVYPGGGLVLADWANRKLKRLSATYQVEDSCAMPSPPWAVCTASSNEVVATLPMLKKVQFVTVAESMTLKRSFKIGKHCRGISCKDEKLYISCDGYTGEGPGHVQVHDLKGNHLLTLKRSPTSSAVLFRMPQHIAASSGHQYVYVADTKKGIVSLKADGDMSTTSSDEILQNCTAICTGKNCLFVYDSSTGSISQVSTDLELLSEIIKTGDNGKHGVQSIAFDGSSSTLVVTLRNSNSIKVFKLTD